MAFYFSKKAREEREKEKELIKQEQEKTRQIELKKKKEYCEWFSKYTKEFIKEVKNSGFNASWGFEVEPITDIQTGLGGKQYNDIFVFDVPFLEGLAFDMESKQMLYFTCGTDYYGKYKDNNVTPKYKYTLIPFSQIFAVNVEINSQTVFSTETSKQNIIGRSIVGGILAGQAGAIIGGTTGNNISKSITIKTPEEIVFTIQTTHPNHPIIAFGFVKPYGTPEDMVCSNKSMFDTMCGIFSNTEQYFTFSEREQKRNCNTQTDYHYTRVENIPNDYDEDNEAEFEPVIDYIMKMPNLEIIQKRVNKYARQIEAIIYQYNKENSSVTQPSINVVEELTKLINMKENGFITEDEFNKIKSKLI